MKTTKKFILLLTIIISHSCFSETEHEKMSNTIHDKMYYKAKLSSYPYQATFNAGRYYCNYVNDSIVFCQQIFSYKNDYGVKKIGKIYGYYNSRTAADVTQYIDFYVNDSEISTIKYLLK